MSIELIELNLLSFYFNADKGMKINKKNITYSVAKRLWYRKKYVSKDTWTKWQVNYRPFNRENTGCCSNDSFNDRIIVAVKGIGDKNVFGVNITIVFVRQVAVGFDVI